jgi:pimeloyl-ACP methyl ester carboxylesterase
VPRLPLVLVHGYSDRAESFEPWVRALTARGYDVAAVHVCTYRSLTNEISIRDVAEGFDRALRLRIGLNADEEFDAIVHSTGMLVMRAWLTAYANRRDRLKHLIGLAPASFGSPLAHKGRSWLGAIFTGSRELGPDFLEAGDRILDGLELGSRFTWDLAHTDLIGKEAYYGSTVGTPYVFVFCGTRGYSGLKGLIDEPGTDGTVRWASCPLNTRKIMLDLTVDPARIDAAERITIAPWANVDVPLIPVSGKDHATIMSDPGKELIDMVQSALNVSSGEQFKRWLTSTQRKTSSALGRMEEFQQFVVRAVDERGDPIPDYNVQLYGRQEGAATRNVREFATDVHVYRSDPSLRCFHVDLKDAHVRDLDTLALRVIASSGSHLVGYTGFGTDKVGDTSDGSTRPGKWDGTLNLSSLLGDAKVKFFYPFTTTLVELKLNREPLPLSGKNEVCWF